MIYFLVKKLDLTQRARRQTGVYPLVYSFDRNRLNDIPSYFRDYYQSFIDSLIKQYHVDESILDYNLYRFSQCFKIFADEFIRYHQYPSEKFLLDDKQKRYAFEFYLQIDGIENVLLKYSSFFFLFVSFLVDLFFMKTCSFRQAIPRSLNDGGLFCIQEPHSQYGFSPCDHCSLCGPRYNLSCREKLGPMIEFGITDAFVFNNGYKTLLNCPADCQTRNLIYVMTCPCGKFEYIGETSQRLNDRLRCKSFVMIFFHLSIYVYINSSSTTFQ